MCIVWLFTNFFLTTTLIISSTCIIVCTVTLSFVAQHEPSMIDINKHVTEKYAPYWKLIGQNLQVPRLSAIQEDYRTHPTPNQQCFRVMINIWLRNRNIASTWKKLQEAINRALQEAINRAVQAQNDTQQTGTYAYLHDISIKQRLHVYPCCIINM